VGASGSAGGSVGITGGKAAAAVGGAVVIQSGAAPIDGNIAITAGAGTVSSGGNVFLKTGAAATTSSGSLILSTVSACLSTGSVELSSGAAYTASAGDVVLIAGAAAGAAAGGITVSGGTSATLAGGNVELKAGKGTTGSGYVHMNDVAGNFVRVTDGEIDIATVGTNGQIKLTVPLTAIDPSENLDVNSQLALGYTSSDGDDNLQFRIQSLNNGRNLIVASSPLQVTAIQYSLMCALKQRLNLLMKISLHKDLIRSKCAVIDTLMNGEKYEMISPILEFVASLHKNWQNLILSMLKSFLNIYLMIKISALRIFIK